LRIWTCGIAVNTIMFRGVIVVWMMVVLVPTGRHFPVA
jgi:hypothetical protein